MNDATCSIEGCGNGGKLTREMCRKHYARWQRHGDPSITKVIRVEGGTVCKVGGCGVEEIKALGYCNAHYLRNLRHGDPTSGTTSHNRGAPCMVDGCDRPYVSKRLCNAHYLRNRIYGDPLGQPGPRLGSPPCSIEGCDQVSTARQLCKTHYSRLRRSGDPLKVAFVKGGVPCKLDECGSRAQAHGYCGMHFQRLSRTGDPLAILRKPRQQCQVDDCTDLNGGFGYCSMHYTRYKRHGDPHALHIYVALRQVLGDIPKAEGACVLWGGHLNRSGYGEASFRRGTRQAHRVTYELRVGPIPDGMHLDHLCRVRACVNPDHLEPVTPAENQRRKWLAYWMAEAQGELTPQQWVEFMKSQSVAAQMR